MATTCAAYAVALSIWVLVFFIRNWNISPIKKSATAIYDQSVPTSVALVLCLFASQGIFLWHVANEAYVPLMPFYAKEVGFGAIGSGLAFASLQAGWLITLPFQGMAQQRMGVRCLIVFGLYLFTVAPLLFCVFPRLSSMVASRLLEGVGMSLLMPMLDAHLTRKIPATWQGKAFGIRNLIGILGKTFGLAGSIVLFPMGGTMLMMLAVSILGTAIMFIDTVFLSDDWLTDSAGLPDTRMQLQMETDVSQRRTSNVPWRLCLAFTLTIHFLSTLSQAAMLVALPLYLSTSMNASMSSIAGTWLLGGVFQVAATLLGASAADSSHPATVIFAGVACQTCLLVFLALIDLNLVSLLFVIAVWLACCGTGSAFLNPVMGKLVKHLHASTMAWSAEELWVSVHMSLSMGFACGGVLAGFIMSFFGFFLLLKTVIIISIVTSMLVLALRWQLEQSPSEVQMDTMRSPDDRKPVVIMVRPGTRDQRALLETALHHADVLFIYCPFCDKKSSWAKELLGVHRWLEGPSDPVLAVSRIIEHLQVLGSPPVDSVLSFKDIGIEIAAALAQRLRLRGPPLNVVCDLRNKVKFREKCAALGINSPQHVQLSGPDDQKLLRLSTVFQQFPAILKPTCGKGSCEIHFISSEVDLLPTLASADARIREGALLPAEALNCGWILEGFLEGGEYDADGFAVDGEVLFLHISENKSSLMPGFRETGGMYPAELCAEDQDKVWRCVSQIIRGFQVCGRGFDGVFHFEFKFHPQHQEVLPIEFNPRVAAAEAPAAVFAACGVCLPTVATLIAIGQTEQVRQIARTACPQRVVHSTNFHFDGKGLVKERSVADDLLVDEAFVGMEFYVEEGQEYDPPDKCESCVYWLAMAGASHEEAKNNLATRQQKIWLNIA